MNLRTEAKLKYLVRLLNLRVKLMSQVDRVSVEYNEYVQPKDLDNIIGMVKVTWYAKPGLNKKMQQFESIEFPVAHLGRRIEHYRRKVRNEFKNRHK